MRSRWRILAPLLLVVGCSEQPIAASSHDTEPPSGPPPHRTCPRHLAYDESSGQCLPVAEESIAVRDGVHLWTRVVLPDDVPEGGVATVLTRTPYRYPGLFGDPLVQLGRFMADRGYAFVMQDCRGRFESEGEFVPFRHEIDDGQDTVRWIARQPWSNGRIGTIGGSYDGYTALAAAIDSPEVQVVIADDAAEDFGFSRIGGVLRTFPLEWLYALDQAALPGDEVRRSLTNRIDLTGLDREVLGRTDPTWQGFLTEDAPGPYPAEESLSGRYEHLCVPVLSVYSSVTLWYDSLRIWQGLRTEACEEHRGDQHIVLTPEPHVYHLGVLHTETTPVTERMLETLDAWLADPPLAPSEMPVVQFYSAGETQLHAAGDLDLGAATRTYHLGSAAGAGTLVDGEPVETPDDVLSVDPTTDDPCDAVAYPSLWYVSEPLAEPTLVAGTARLQLELTSSTPDVDLFATLWDYDETGHAAPTREGLGSLRARYREALDAPGPLPLQERVSVTVELPPFAHRFERGRRILLGLTTGMCGWFENPHTGEPIRAQTRAAPATIRIHRGGRSGSRLELPIVGP